MRNQKRQQELNHDSMLRRAEAERSKPKQGKGRKLGGLADLDF